MPFTHNRHSAKSEKNGAHYTTPPGEIVYNRLAFAAYHGQDRRGTYHAGLRLTASETEAFEEACWTLFLQRYPRYEGTFGLPVHVHDDGRGRYIKVRSHIRPRILDVTGRPLDAMDDHRAGLVIGSLYAWLNAERAGVSFYITQLTVTAEATEFRQGEPSMVGGM